MSEWVLIVILIGGYNGAPSVSVVRLPTQQACIDVGDATRHLWSMIVSRTQYTCVEIKQTSPRRTP